MVLFYLKILFLVINNSYLIFIILYIVKEDLTLDINEVRYENQKILFP